MYQRMFWKAYTIHDIEKLDSCKNTNSNAKENLNKATYPIDHFNYYCRYKSPKILNSV
jgi:hypothetical protein